MKNRTMKLIFTLSLCFCITTGQAQDYWVSAINGGPFDEAYNAIKTSDDGVITVGTASSTETYIIKYNSTGEILWTERYPLNPQALIATALSVVEGDNAYFVSETGFSPSYMANIIKINKDGSFIERYTTEGHDINEIMIDANGNLLAIYNDPFNGNKNTLKKLDQNFNLLWELDLSLGRFPLFDSHAYVDNNNQIQIWMEDSQNNGQILRLVIDSDGEIITQDSYPTIQTTPSGILHRNLDDSKGVYVAAGGNVNGTTRTLTLVDLESQEQLQQKELADDFFWITDLSTFDDKIYVLGQSKEGDDLWSKILVLDNELNELKNIELKDLVLAETNSIEGISCEEMKLDEEGNILITGILLAGNPNIVEPVSSGYLTMYLNPEGGLDNISMTEFDDYTDLALYPNPCRDQLWIEADLESSSNIEIYNNLGQKIRSINSVNFPYQLNTENFQDGSYFLILENDQRRMTELFIKK